MLASLNHPGIAAIYGIEEQDDTRALVLELVEGPTLADRIAKGPIPVDEALPIAKQIAEALEAAHEAGVIHRDLKPMNIKVREDGTVKVLDFGLAKALDPIPDGDPSQSPTLTAAATQMGVIMGTAAYMSPEQARGLPVDKRADVWAFGVVLYEMLTGKRPFQGEDVSLTLASVMKSDLNVKTLPPDVPATVRTVLRRCLEKDPKERIRDIGDVSLAMKGAFETTGGAAVEAATTLQLWQRPIPAAIVASVLVAITGLAVWAVTRPEVVREDPVQFTIIPPAGTNFGFAGRSNDLTITRDGAQIVYHGRGGTAPGQLYLRPLNQLVGAPLRGGQGASPFVSPDGAWIGSLSSPRTLQKVSILGGVPMPLTLTPSPDEISGASWGDGQIVFGTAGAGLFRVSADGGEPEVLTTLDTEQGDANHTWPFIMPGDEFVVFVIGTGPPLTTGQLAVLDLDTRAVTRLGLAGVSPHYVSTGHLVYADQDGSLRAVPFDTASLEVTGNPVSVVDSVIVKGGGAADFAISDNGRLVYAAGSGVGGTQQIFVKVNRIGQEEPLAAEPKNYREFTLSPGGSRVAARVAEGLQDDVWVYDIARNIPSRLTFGETETFFPTWNHDGTRLAFGPPLSWRLANGTLGVEVLAEDGRLVPQAFSPDSALLVFEDRTIGNDIGMLTLDEDRSPTLLLESEFTERNASLSPDGRWIAYESNRSGVTEVVVRPFPDVDTGRWVVSSGFGRWPVWNPAGKELFFSTADHLVALAYDDDPTFTQGTVNQLFEMAPYAATGSNRRIAVFPDGDQFLLLKSATGQTNTEDSAVPQIIVRLNFDEELTRLFPDQ